MNLNLSPHLSVNLDLKFVAPRPTLRACKT
jgi:hypothetical protein